MQELHLQDKKSLILALFILQALFSGTVFSQGAPDRMSTNKEDAWISCTPGINPNALRGIGHWIRYDLGMKKQLGKSTFWNLNHPDLLDSGVREIAIDVSDDGLVWQEAATYKLEKAGASGFYNGVEGPDLNNATGRYLLITALSNHGGACYGLAEIRIEATIPSNTEQTDNSPQNPRLDAIPNPAVDHILIGGKKPLAGEPYHLLDISGRQVGSGRYNAESGISVSGLAPGLYLVRISNTEVKFVKI